MNVGAIIGGKFRLERELGRGAMGMVVEATDIVLRQRVAVKLILPHHADDPQHRARFIREARAMRRLTTEHVARVFEVGELNDGTLFLAMEFLEGQSLEALVQQGGPLPVALAIDLVLEALEAVAEAHALGLVHRDLKPSNMFLSVRSARRPPILKVIDFGIVKDTGSSARLTGSGTLPGTPAYMAPEQIALEGEPLDARVDVWALGVTLFELLTGSLPWNGPLNVMLSRIQWEAPPRLRASRPDVSPELEALVERCLSKEPAGRYANGAELADALQALRRGLVAGPEERLLLSKTTIPDRAVRRSEEVTAFDARGLRSRTRIVMVAIVIVTLSVIIVLILGMQGRLS